MFVSHSALSLACAFIFSNESASFIFFQLLWLVGKRFGLEFPRDNCIVPRKPINIDDTSVLVFQHVPKGLLSLV